MTKTLCEKFSEAFFDEWPTGTSMEKMFNRLADIAEEHYARAKPAEQISIRDERIAVLTEALTFYADSRNWTDREQFNLDEHFDTAMSFQSDQHGLRARNALSAFPALNPMKEPT